MKLVNKLPCTIDFEVSGVYPAGSYRVASGILTASGGMTGFTVSGYVSYAVSFPQLPDCVIEGVKGTDTITIAVTQEAGSG